VPATRRISASSRASTSGLRPSSYQVQVSVFCGGLVTGEQERHHLVAHLVIGERRAVVFVAGEQEHRQDVAAIGAEPPALGDQAIHDVVEQLHRALHAQVTR